MNKPSTKETNGQAAQRLLSSAGIEEVSRLRFNLPNGSRVMVESEDDAFLNELFQPGTKISLLISAQAGASVKIAGDYWFVYQNDPDDNWPSDFHSQQ